MTTVIVMPGTGSDEDYSRRVFGPGAARLGARLVCLEPTANLIEDYLTSMDAVAQREPRDSGVIVGGVSIGAAVALRWALESAYAERCTGVLAALPPWTGTPDDSLAALSAILTADSVERDGLDAAIASMTETSPEWLGTELARSWRRLSDRGLVRQLRAAAAHVTPEESAIARLTVPLGVAVAPDDPLHPAQVGRAWAAVAPCAEVREAALTEFGPQPHLLGDACYDALELSGQLRRRRRRRDSAEP